MNYDELNEYIKHYIEKDKTQSAIMLTGGWGIGKSYYIHKFLEPFLKEPENGKHRCAIVSLYGLKNTSEISKRIYFELRTIGSPKKNEAKSTAGAAAKVVAKTILNGLTSKIGFDIGSISDKDLDKVYSSIDLTNVLVVFEDLERSSIDIIDVLGYVNSLVEQDGAKVLLIANEDEILKYHDSQSDKDGKTYKVPDEKNEIYLKAKEKTISDTIIFKGNLKYAIKNILASFDDTPLFILQHNDEIRNIQFIINKLQNYNLRSLIFACQKAVDIYEKLDDLKYIDEFYIKSIFYGIVAFLFSAKNRIFPEIENNVQLYYVPGLSDYPLYNFCYKYIRGQQFDQHEAIMNFREHQKQITYSKDIYKYDEDLKVLFSFYTCHDNEVLQAIKILQIALTIPMIFLYTVMTN